jgi:hypothetical protein
MFLILVIGAVMLKNIAFYIPNFGHPRTKIFSVSNFPFGLSASSISPSISIPNFSFLPQLGVGETNFNVIGCAILFFCKSGFWLVFRAFENSQITIFI